MSTITTTLNRQGHNFDYALIVANGQDCSRFLLDSLIKNHPFVVILDGAIHRFVELGIHFDVLLGDFDRDEVDLASIQKQFPHVQIVPAEDQEKTDLEKAIDYLIHHQFTDVDIVWATGRRADHTITNITNLCRYRNKIKARIVDDYSSIRLLPRHFSKFYEKGTPISLIPVGTVEGITTQNLKYALTDESLFIGYRTGSSNEVEETGIVEIEYKTGDLLLMECVD